MSNCPQCGAPVAPNSRFCTECGRPLAAANQVPTPSAPPAQPGMVPPPVPGMTPPPVPGARPPVPPPFPGQPGMAPPAPGMMPPAPMSQMTGMPPAPPAQPGFRPPVPPAPTGLPPVPPMSQTGTMAPPPVAQPAFTPPTPAQAPQAPATVSPAPATADNIRMAAAGDLYNNGQPVAVIVTENRLVIVHNGGAMKVEEVSGVRHALVGDFDGDGTQDLALFSDSHVWLVRFGPMGSVPSGKVPVQTMPEHLILAPFTHDGRSVLASLSRERATFYVLHPSKGLVEVCGTALPLMEP